MRRFCQTISVLSSSILVALLLVEVMCQLFPRVLPAQLEYLGKVKFRRNYADILAYVSRHPRNPHLFQYDARLGWMGRPNLAGTYWHPDGSFTFRTNSLGFRDIDRDGPDPNRKRILVLGDSFIWGLPLNQDELVPQLLQRKLAKSGLNVEVYNLGVSGYGTDQEYLVFKEYGVRYKPDLVILFFFYSNDFLDNGQRVSSGKGKPYFRIDGSGELQLCNSPVAEKDSCGDKPERGGDETFEQPLSMFGRMKGWLDDRTLLYPIVVGKIRNIGLIDDLLVLSGIGSRTSVEDRVNEVQDRERERYIQRTVTRRVLLALKLVVEKNGGELLVVLFPGYGYGDGRREDYMQARRFFNSEVGEIALLDLAVALERSTKRTYGRFIEHWTKEGAELAATELCRYVEEMYASQLSPEWGEKKERRGEERKDRKC